MQQKTVFFGTETFSCTEAFKSRILPGNAELQLGIVLFSMGKVADVPLAFHVSGPNWQFSFYFEDATTL
ncbi:MAG: hypothetical protein FDX02_02330 [Chlorobium sp.]|nr:MAG: hypothetical protein FDX02_02330 [Chlorobium sp.]